MIAKQVPGVVMGYGGMVPKHAILWVLGTTQNAPHCSFLTIQWPLLEASALNRGRRWRE